MPTKDKNQTAVDAPAGATQPETAQHTSVVRKSPPWKLIIIGTVVTIVVIALIAAAWAFVASRRQARFGGMDMSGYGNGGSYFGRRGGAGGGGNFRGIAARGVVTSVNGDTVTVSGAGKQISVSKANATITGDKTDLAVNDTVVVYGTTNSDGSVMATRIVVRNRQTTGTDTGSGVGSGMPGA